MPPADRFRHVISRNDALAGLMVGAIWGFAEYTSNILLFRLYWGYHLEIGPSGLLLSLISGAGAGVILALLSRVAALALILRGRDRSRAGEGFGLRVTRCSFLVASVSIYVFIKATYLPRIPLFDPTALPGIGAFAAISLLAYLGLKRLSRNWIRRGRGGTLAFLSISVLLGVIATCQYLATYHRLNAREDLAPPQIPQVRADLPNVLLVTIDTLRPDHLGCYGSRIVESGTVDALARQGVLFENAVCQYPLTLPSHSSIMTSLYPGSHGVLSNTNYRLQDELVTLAEVLRGQGYRTAAFVSSIVLGHWRGLDQGFEHYDDEEMSVHFTLPELLRGLPSITPDRDILWWRLFPKLVYHLDLSYRRAEFTTTRARAWLLEQRGREEPFFLWVHYYDPHIPLNPPEPYAGMYSMTEEMRRTIQAKTDSLVLRGPMWEILRNMPDPSLYDGEVTYADHQLGRVIHTLEEQHAIDNTLIVLTADHGEHLMEHNFFGHSRLLYRPSVRIPLILSHRGKLPAGSRVRPLAASIDIAPTILDHLGLPIPAAMEGRSLLPDIDGSGPPGFEPSSLVETFRPEVPLLSYVTGSWSFIMTIDDTKKELYNNTEDPGQRDNLCDEKPALADSLEAMLREMRSRYSVAGMEERSRRGVDTRTLEKLRTLGYVQ